MLAIVLANAILPGALQEKRSNAGESEAFPVHASLPDQRPRQPKELGRGHWQETVPPACQGMEATSLSVDVSASLDPVRGTWAHPHHQPRQEYYAEVILDLAVMYRVALRGAIWPSKQTIPNSASCACALRKARALTAHRTTAHLWP